YPASLKASWTVSFDRLITDDHAALQLLSLLAWLAPEPVPLTLITQHPQQLPDPLAATVRDPLAVADRIATLRRRGLVRATPDTPPTPCSYTGFPPPCYAPAPVESIRTAVDGWSPRCNCYARRPQRIRGTTPQCGQPGANCSRTSSLLPTKPATSTLRVTPRRGYSIAPPAT